MIRGTDSSFPLAGPPGRQKGRGHNSDVDGELRPQSERDHGARATLNLRPVRLAGRILAAFSFPFSQLSQEDRARVRGDSSYPKLPVYSLDRAREVHSMPRTSQEYFQLLRVIRQAQWVQECGPSRNSCPKTHFKRPLGSSACLAF